jgi:hypothetical protein
VSRERIQRIATAAAVYGLAMWLPPLAGETGSAWLLGLAVTTLVAAWVNLVWVTRPEAAP